MIYNKKQKFNLAETIHVLSDYVILNAPAINSSCLYEGRAGISLCLFEVSRMLNNKEIEEYAFELLKESLLCKTYGILFSRELPGIGFALNYLIRHHFIRANFIDIFHKQHKYIVSHTIEIDIKNWNINRLVDYYELNYYFFHLQESACTKKMLQTNSITFKKFSAIWKELTNENSIYKNNIENLCSVWRQFITCVYLTRAPINSLAIQLYLENINNGRIKSDTLVLYCIKHSICNHKNNQIFLLINRIEKLYNNTNGSVIHPCMQMKTFSIPHIENIEIKTSIFNHFNDINCQELENTVSKIVANSKTIIGIRDGIARIILILIYAFSMNQKIDRIHDIPCLH